MIQKVPMSNQEIDAQKWLKCNKCFREVGKHPFFLTSCSHVFCDNCLKNAKARNECPQCGCKELLSMSLSDAMNGPLQHVFESIENPLEKMQQAIIFQKRQLLLNSTRLHDVEKKYLNCKIQCHRFMKSERALNDELKKTQNRVKELERKVQELENRTTKVAYMVTPSFSQLEGPNQQYYTDTRNDSHRFEQRYSHLNSELSFFNQHAPMRMKTQKSEFLAPKSTKIPRSLGSSTRSSKDSSKGTVFSDYTPHLKF